ncbi:MAG TPA: O-acetyl-ADP-ribose deacetylase [Nitrospirae bacterium]|nr:O-acetyl-ADP-ribose deacetylase [bacterium BMS3Abin06]HDH13021.1 O-acetyl-ADP-ribose deacetylase [Nitrospirota bacterium]HDZ02945.1 O-acetyl-ADP-ribose deacetylase [Nitrospirota bacterium]
MEIKINKGILSLAEGDITKQDTDAIVNAANKSLRGGGGVDGAIHRAGGPKILEECIRAGGCETGEAVITTGGNLKAKYVIHTVGPVYRDGLHNESKLLENAYKNCLKLASSKGVKSIAFPSISTGAYRYPLEEAAEIALNTAITYLKGQTDIELIRFVLFGQKALEVYEKVLKRLI